MQQLQWAGAGANARMASGWMHSGRCDHTGGRQLLRVCGAQQRLADAMAKLRQTCLLVARLGAAGRAVLLGPFSCESTLGWLVVGRCLACWCVETQSCTKCWAGACRRSLRCYCVGPKGTLLAQKRAVRTHEAQQHSSKLNCFIFFTNLAASLQLSRQSFVDKPRPV